MQIVQEKGAWPLFILFIGNYGDGIMGTFPKVPP